MPTVEVSNISWKFISLRNNETVLSFYLLYLHNFPTTTVRIYIKDNTALFIESRTANGHKKERRHYWDMHLLYYKLKSFTYWQIHSHPAYEVTNEKSFQEANLHVPKNASTQVLVFRQIVFSIYIKHSNFLVITECL